MDRPSELLVLTPPGRARAVQAAGLTPVHLAYRVGEGPHLFRSSQPLALRGGILAMDCPRPADRGDPGAFCQEVLRECAARGFQGVFCAFEGAPAPLLRRIVAALEPLLARRNWPLYVPEAYAAGGARILISSALSGGSLRLRLEEAVERYGPERVVLLVEPLSEDFPLPSPTGQGVPLTREELSRRREELQPAVFFSSELCAHYFTYMAKGDGAHFVLFDDAGSIRKKLQIAAALGISRAVLALEQAEELLPGLLRPSPGGK